MPDTQHVHDIVESRGDERLLSKSCTIKGRRRLSVMRKEMMEGLAYTSAGNVVVVDIPNVKILPSEVGDLGELSSRVESVESRDRKGREDNLPREAKEGARPVESELGCF